MGIYYIKHEHWTSPKQRRPDTKIISLHRTQQQAQTHVAQVMLQEMQYLYSKYDVKITRENLFSKDNEPFKARQSASLDGVIQYYDTINVSNVSQYKIYYIELTPTSANHLLQQVLGPTTTKTIKPLFTIHDVASDTYESPIYESIDDAILAIYKGD